MPPDIGEILFIALFLIPCLLLICQVFLNWRNLAGTFGVGNVLVVTAIIASSLGVFRSWGWLLIGVSLVGCLAIAAAAHRHALHLSLACGLASTGSALVLLLAIPQLQQAAKRANGAAKLKQIVVAMHNYHDVHGTFPPAYLTDTNGVPQHSWRVMILPWIGHGTLHGKYDFNEPWDGPNNRKLLPLIPREYQSTSVVSNLDQGEYRTPFVVILDDDGAMRGAESLRLTDMDTDCAASTILVVEAPNHYPLWTEPADLESAEALAMFLGSYPGTTGGHRIDGWFRDRSAGWNAAMVDGSLGWMAWDTPESRWRTWIRRDDTTTAAETSPADAGKRKPNLHWNRLLGLVVFGGAYSLGVVSAWRATGARLSGGQSSVLGGRQRPAVAMPGS